MSGRSSVCAARDGLAKGKPTGKRQRVRRCILLVSFFLFPITIFYFSPLLIVLGALEGVVAASAIAFSLQFLVAIVLRRAFCGWICPAGCVQELAFGVNGKPAKLGWRRFIKYAIWVPWIVSIVACAWVAGGFAAVDPFYHTPGGISMNSPMGLGIYLGIVALFFVPSLVFGRRAGCHYFCWMAPFMVLGEKLGRVVRVPQLHIAADPDRCVACGRCTKACPMSLDVEGLLRAGGIRDAECIQCAECADACPKGALGLTVGRLR